MVLDTNIIIYAAKPGGERLRSWLEHPSAITSILSRIEALGFPQLTPEEKIALERAFASLPESDLTEAIAIQAISLRQLRKIALADAIIAATALVEKVALITRNVDDFKHITGLEIIDPFADQAAPPMPTP